MENAFLWCRVSGILFVKTFVNEVIKLGLVDGAGDWTGGQ